jgi:hypothetical protein
MGNELSGRYLIALGKSLGNGRSGAISAKISAQSGSKPVP